MRQANVYLHDIKAGVLTEDENGYAFRYDGEYLKSERAEAISLTMPLTDRAYEDKVLFPFFDGLIPEGWLLDLVETNWKIDARDRMSLLLACCRDCVGAVSVVPIEAEEEDGSGRRGEVEAAWKASGDGDGGKGELWKMVVEERERDGGIVNGGGGRCLCCYGELKEGERDFHPGCARKMFGRSDPPQLPYVRKDVENLAKEVVRRRITVPGVQEKLSVELSGDRKGMTRFTIVGLWGKYILKPQTEKYEHLPEIEDLTMHLAQIAGINVAQHSLFRFADGELCYLTKRFDRLDNGKKVAVEDMCQLTGRLTEMKYKGSYEQIAKTVLKYAVSPLISVETFWETVIFSWLTGNSDMHLKNFSLWDPFFSGDYMMAPGYDLLSTWMVMEDKEELALTLNAKKRKIGRQDFVEAMRRSGLNDRVIRIIFMHFLNVGGKWMEFIDKSFIPESMKADYKRLIEERLSRIEL